MDHVLIVGAGIGGLAASAVLSRIASRVTLVERAERPTEVGAALALQPNGMAVLDRLGLLPRVLDVGTRIDRMNIRSASGAVLATSCPPLRTYWRECRRSMISSSIRSAGSTAGGGSLVALCFSATRLMPWLRTWAREPTARSLMRWRWPRSWPRRLHSCRPWRVTTRLGVPGLDGCRTRLESCNACVDLINASPCAREMRSSADSIGSLASLRPASGKHWPLTSVPCARPLSWQDLTTQGRDEPVRIASHPLGHEPSR